MDGQKPQSNASFGVADGFSASDSSISWMSAGRSPLRLSNLHSKESSTGGAGLGRKPAACRASCAASPNSAHLSLSTFRKPLVGRVCVPPSPGPLRSLRLRLSCWLWAGLRLHPGPLLTTDTALGWVGTCEAQHQQLHPCPLQTW